MRLLDKIPQAASMFDAAIDIKETARWHYSTQRIDNVLGYYPCVKLPWERSWFEYRLPAGLGGFQTGTFVYYANYLIMRPHVFVNRSPYPIFDIGFEVDKNTGEIKSNRVHVERNPIKGKVIPQEVIEDHGHIFVMPVLFALSLLNCKNVTFKDEKLSKKRQKRIERDKGVRYKVLDIHPFRQQVRRETRPGENEITTALHICRGHFKDYREKGLFGKYKDIYWWDMHTRGNPDIGTIEKDYRIVPPVS